MSIAAVVVGCGWGLAQAEEAPALVEAAAVERTTGDSSSDTGPASSPPASPTPTLTAPERGLVESARLEALDWDARVELVSFQTLAGAFAAAQICTIAGCTEGNLILDLAGGALGLGLSLWFSADHRNTPGRTVAINSGSVWGFWHGSMLALIAGSEFEHRWFEASQRRPILIPLFALSGQLAGTAAGAALGTWLSPRAGTLSAANSAGLWGGALMLMVNAAADWRLFGEDRGLWASLLIATDLSAVAGGLAGWRFQVERPSAFLTDLGGILGLLYGVPLVLQFQKHLEEREQILLLASATLAGLGAGIAVASLLPNEDVELPRLSLAPLRRGALLTLEWSH